MGKKLKPIEFLTPENRASIENDIRIFEKQMKGGDDNRSDGVGFMSHAVNRVQSPGDIQREIRKRKAILKAGTPQPFKNKRQANQAYAWAKKAEKWIKENKPNENDVGVVYPDKGRQEHDFARNVDRMVDWMRKGEKVQEMYRYIMRRLEPQNPNAGNLR